MTKTNLLIATFGICLTSCSLNKPESIRIDREISSIRSVVLKHSQELEQIRLEIRTLTGRIEELESSGSKNFGEEVTNLKSTISTILQRVPPPSVVPTDALEKSLESADALPSAITRRFKEALSLIKAGDFAASQQILSECLESSASEGYVPELLFWSGVAHDGLEDDRGALMVYRKIVSEHPKSPLVPSALLRQAKALMRLRDLEGADVILKIIVADYPRSPEAKEARDKLAR